MLQGPKVSCDSGIKCSFLGLWDRGQRSRGGDAWTGSCRRCCSWLSGEVGWGISGRESSIDYVKSSREQRVSPGVWVAMKASGQRCENHKSGVLLPGVVEIDRRVVRIVRSGGVCCVLSFSSAWSQSESTDLVCAVQNSHQVADVGGVPQSLGTRGDQRERSETLREAFGQARVVGTDGVLGLCLLV